MMTHRFQKIALYTFSGHMMGSVKVMVDIDEAIDTEDMADVRYACDEHALKFLQSMTKSGPGEQYLLESVSVEERAVIAGDDAL